MTVLIHRNLELIELITRTRMTARPGAVHASVGGPIELTRAVTIYI